MGLEKKSREEPIENILNRGNCGPDSNWVDPGELALRLQKVLANQERINRKSRVIVASHSVSAQHTGTNR